MKKLWRKVLANLLIFATSVSSVNMPVYAAENSTTTMYAQEASALELVTDNVDWDQVTTEDVYLGENYKVTYTLDSCWDTGYNANIRVENTGNVSIQNWYLSFDNRNEIVNVWNAEIYEKNANNYVIKNVGWNQDIAVGGSVEFGISGQGAFIGFPENYNIAGAIAEVEDKKYLIEYTVDSDWESGFTSSIKLSNNAETVIEDWVLEFDFDREITNIWNGVIERHEGNHYVIRNIEHNANIAPGQMVLFGFSGEGGTVNAVPFNCMLYSQTIDNTEYVELADGKIDKNYLERAIYTNLLLQGLPIDNVCLSDDYDSDGLNLAEEYEYDTNPFSKDTDEDGINDFEEINLYKTNPIKYDTDEDKMGDGVEIACGLNPLSPDTNDNGITDNQEITTQAVTIDSIERYKLQEVGTLPHVQITGKGDYSQSIHIEAVELNDTIKDIECLVGTAFDFVHDEDLSFTKSKLTFSISDSVLEKYSLDELAIAWYNEEENALELLETTYDMENCTISAEVKHYSTYMVVSVPDYFFYIDWENEASTIESGKADVVFVIDTTGSMENEIQNVKDNIETFVSELEENSVDIRLGLIEYRDIYADGVDSTKNHGWYTSVEIFEEELASLTLGGGGGDGPETIVDALFCASNMEYRTGVKKYIIVLTDADYHNGTSVKPATTLEEETARLAKENFYVSIVTTTNYYSLYKDVANQTEGILANINENFASALSPLISKMSEQVNQGCWIRLANGSIVVLDKDPALGDETVDTDEDGIPDIIELKSNYIVSVYNPYLGGRQEISTWSFYSNPAKRDTDGDGLIDVDDLDPAVYDTVVIEANDTIIKFNTGRVWNKIPCTSFDYLDNFFVFADGHVNNAIPMEEFREIIQKELANEEQIFSIPEMAYIGILDSEGSKLYMHRYASSIRERVFQEIMGRDSKYYQHTGTLWSDGWKEVPEGTEGGFFKGKVLSEADINLSWELYLVTDVYTVLQSLTKVGATVIIVVVAVKATPAVVANLQGLTYYVKTFGIVQGMQMYRNLGLQNLPDGVISWLQMDMADGDSSLDDLIGSNIPIYQRGILGEKALELAYPEGGKEYFQTFVNGIRGGRYVDWFSGEIAHEAKVGYTCLSQRIKTQILKDVYIKTELKTVRGIIWHFYRSDITGRIGATPQLLEFLTNNGIEYIIHY